MKIYILGIIIILLSACGSNETANEKIEQEKITFCELKSKILDPQVPRYFMPVENFYTNNELFVASIRIDLKEASGDRRSYNVYIDYHEYYVANLDISIQPFFNYVNYKQVWGMEVYLINNVWTIVRIERL